MTNQHINNLLFLLASGSLALGCDVEDDDDGGSGQDTAATDDGTAGDDDHGTADEHGSTAGDDVQETGADSGTAADADGTAGDTAGDTGTAGDTSSEPTVCFNFAKTAAGCDDTVDQTEEYDYCEGLLDYYAAYSKDCLTAAEEFYACLGTLDCRTFNANEGCEAEVDVFAEACPLPEETGTDGETGTTGG